MKIKEKKIKILFVEDLSTDVEIAKRELKKGGISFEYRLVESESDFIHEIENYSPDIIISDYSMPEFDGMSALELKLLLKNDIPFVMLTGSMNEETAVKCMRDGADDYVIKEQIKRLPFAVKEALDKYKSKREKEAMEKQIVDSLQEYRALINGMSETVWIISLDGELIDVNNSAIRQLGFSRKELLELGLNGIDNYLSSEEIYDLFRNLENQTFQIFQTIHKTKDGKNIPVEISSSLIKFQGEKAILIIARDISDRIEAAKKIEISEKRFKSFLNSTTDLVQLEDENGIIVFANNVFLREFNLKENEIIGKRLLELIPEKFARICEKSSQKVLETLDVTREVEAFGDKHFEVLKFPTNMGNGKVGVGAFIRDITEKLIYEEKIKLLNRSVEQNPIAIIITDKDGLIEYVNPAFTNITAYSFSEVFGDKPNILKSEYHSKEFYEKLWNTITSGKDWEGEFKNIKKNGDYYWEKAVISPIVNNNNEITHFVAVKEDITEKKKMFEDLIAAKEKAEESDKLKSAFLANMSHEIRTPMNGIIAFADLLNEPHFGEKDQSKFIEIIQKSAKRLLSLINDLIDISKIEAGQMEVHFSEINVNNLLEFLFEFFKPEAEKKSIELKMISDKSPLIINTDNDKLNAILTNLIKNAIKFTDSGKIEFGYSLNGDKSIEFFIEDTGIGIPKDKLKSVLNRFEQVDSSFSSGHEGSGLGLAISNSYVEMLGGELKITSEVGKGSKFSFILEI
jgi:PAS domain S-box-containing protein